MFTRFRLFTLYGLDEETWTVYGEDEGLVYNKARELVIDNVGVLNRFNEQC